MQRLRVMERIGHMSHYSNVSNAISKKKIIRSRDQNLKSNSKTLNKRFSEYWFLEIWVFLLKHRFTPAWLRNKDVLVAFSQSVYMCIWRHIKHFILSGTYMFNVSSGICLELAAKFHCLWLQYFVGYAPRLYIFI